MHVLARSLLLHSIARRGGRHEPFRSLLQRFSLATAQLAADARRPGCGVARSHQYRVEHSGYGCLQKHILQSRTSRLHRPAPRLRMDRTRNPHNVIQRLAESRNGCQKRSGRVARCQGKQTVPIDQIVAEHASITQIIQHAERALSYGILKSPAWTVRRVCRLF